MPVDRRNPYTRHQRTEDDLHELDAVAHEHGNVVVRIERQIVSKMVGEPGRALDQFRPGTLAGQVVEGELMGSGVRVVEDHK